MQVYKLHKDLVIKFLKKLLVFVLFLCLNPGLNAQNAYHVRTVVIDAGHGGKDPGAIGRFSKEKNITLAIALKVGYYIKRCCPDVKVIYTRTKDVFVPLYKRAEIANKAKADLFISIHVNSSKNHRVYGASTYVMGLHKDKDNLRVAMQENRSILYEKDYKKHYQNFDINSPEAYIIFSLYQNAYLDLSLQFAQLVQNQFSQRAKRRDLGVHQAGFVVLWRTTMPSVLIEVGYISNPAEERFLNSKYGQDIIASAIYRAFKQYKFKFDK